MLLPAQAPTPTILLQGRGLLEKKGLAGQMVSAWVPAQLKSPEEPGRACCWESLCQVYGRPFAWGGHARETLKGEGEGQLLAWLGNVPDLGRVPLPALLSQPPGPAVRIPAHQLCGPPATYSSICTPLGP